MSEKKMDEIRNRRPSKKTEIVWIASKRKNKKMFYRNLSQEQLKTEYISDDLEHLFKPYGCEK